MNFWTRHRQEFSLVALGAAHALSFAPGPLPAWGLPLVQLIAFAAFTYYLFQSTRLAQAAQRAFLFGWANFAVGLYWLYTSMHLYGGMHSALAVAAVLLLAAGMALYGTIAAALVWWFLRRTRPNPARTGSMLLATALFASVWALTEWLRGTLFTGFPWLAIGYAHADGIFSGWAAVVGVYGMSWLSAFTAAAIALVAQTRPQGNDQKAVVVLGLALVAGLAGMLIKYIPWAHPHGDPLIVRLAQGNIPQSQKFDPGHIQQGIDTYLTMAGLPPKAADGAPKIIVLPETVVPLFQNRVDPSLWQRWIDVARERNAGVILGVPLADTQGDLTRYTNSAIGITANTPLNAIIAGRPDLRYDKHHLVPFGEFVPTGFRWFVDTMTIPLGDFARGPLPAPLFSLAGQRIAPNICYEDVFGEEIIQFVRDRAPNEPGATLLVNMSNLAWFGDSWALRQHLQISRVRALETARPMLRATNTGSTAAIDPNGNVRAQLPAGVPGVLDVEVQGMTGLTPYVQWGNTPVLFLSVMVLGLAAGRRKDSEPSANTH